MSRLALLRRRLADHRRSLAVSLSLAVLIVASFLLAVFAEQHHIAQERQAARVQAQVLADAIAGALAFDDENAINQYTSALRENPDILAVGVYDDKGSLVARYGSQTVPSRLEDAVRAPPAGAFAVDTPVTQGGLKLGTVYIREATEPLMLRLARYSGAALLVVMATLMLSVMALDARKVRAGNERLVKEMADREIAEAALRQSQKMEAVGRLTGGIAHDFNNMLAVVLGNLDLLLRRFPNADPVLLRFVSSSQEAAKRAAGLTHRLLAFSRRQPLDPKPTDVGKTVQDMSELIGRTLGETISIETIRGAGLWRAHVDAGQLETALVNLAVNARDAMPDGGKLTLETNNAYLDRTYVSGQDEVTPGQYVMVAVTDTGTGMSQDVLDKVFEPFFTTKPVGLGTGLGLSQVHGFVKQSGGHIAVYSEPGRGTTVKLYLPRAAADGEAAAPEPGRRASGSRRDLSVLVVDDEAGVRDFAADALVELGYDVMSASDASEALRIVAKGGRLDILLTDVVMPGRSGRQLADEVMKAKPEVRVLYMTGYTQNAIVHNGVLDTGTHLITKPFTVHQLGVELDALMDG
jgi:signal transduction histidine kinase